MSWQRAAATFTSASSIPALPRLHQDWFDQAPCVHCWRWMPDQGNLRQKGGSLGAKGANWEEEVFGRALLVEPSLLQPHGVCPGAS